MSNLFKNAFDRVFRAASMVQAGKTPFDVLHNDGLVSLVRFLRAKGFEVYLINWGIPTRKHSHYLGVPGPYGGLPRRHRSGRRGASVDYQPAL